MRTDVDCAEITLRPYAGDGRDRLPNATLRHYRNLRRHRSTILEGVRRIAVRNINHLIRTMTRLGIRDLGREGDAKEVLNVLFEEQGMGADVNSRPMVDYINMVPWEMYLCLLYVELENYRSASRRDPGLAFGPLEELFDSKSAAIEDLKTVRDKVLHPAKGIELGDALDREAGYIVRSDLQTGERHTIGPAHPEGIDLRYNWNPGMAIDPHDGSLYIGSQFVHRSTAAGGDLKEALTDVEVLFTGDTMNFYLDGGPQRIQRMESWPDDVLPQLLDLTGDGALDTYTPSCAKTQPF